MLDERWEWDTLFLIFEEDFRFYPSDGDNKVAATTPAQVAADLSEEALRQEPKTGRKVRKGPLPPSRTLGTREPSARDPVGIQSKTGSRLAGQHTQPAPSPCEPSARGDVAEAM